MKSLTTLVQLRKLKVGGASTTSNNYYLQQGKKGALRFCVLLIGYLNTL